MENDIKVSIFFAETISLSTHFFVALKATSFIKLVNLSKLDFKNQYQSKFLKQPKITEIVILRVVDNSLRFIKLSEVLNSVLTNERKSYLLKV